MIILITKPLCAQSTEEKPLPEELVPYEILIDFHAEESPVLTAEVLTQVKKEVENQIRNQYGPSWNLHWAEESLVLHRDSLGRLDSENLIQETRIEEKYDKVFFISLTTEGARYIVEGREWDVTIRELTEIHSSFTFDRQELPWVISNLAGKLFQPLFMIDRVDLNSCFLRARAGELVPQNPALLSDGEETPEENSFLQPFDVNQGSVLVAYYRYFDKDKSIRSIRPVDWTYLSIDKVDRASIDATVISAFRSPISARRLRRVELVAVLKKPLFPNTEMKIYPQGNHTLPFAGLKLQVERKLHKQDEYEGEPEKFWTDRDGKVSISRNENSNSPVCWLYAISGEVLVARIPFAPGIVSAINLEIPDDSVRLSVEGELALLESELIISVTKRTILISRVKKMLLDGQWDRIEEVFKEMDELKKPETYKQELANIRVNATQSVGDDRRAAAKIRNLCQDMEKLINRYIDPAKIRDFQTEIRSLKSENAEDVKKWLDEQQKKEEEEKKKNSEKQAA